MFDPANVIFGAARPDPEFQIADFSDGNEMFLLSGDAARESFNAAFAEVDMAAFFEPENFESAVGTATQLKRPSHWPIKDQSGVRGTCTPFNLLAAVEMIRADGGPAEPLSEEFLYSKMRREFRDLAPENQETGATFLAQAVAALKTFGICSQSRLRYQGPKPHPAWSVRDVRHLENEITPPDLSSAQVYMNLTPEEVYGATQAMLRLFKRPVCVSLPIYPEGDTTPWTYGIGWDTGNVPDPAPSRYWPDVEDVGGHSFCIVDHVPDPDRNTLGWYIFRNSWGEGFGRRPSPHPVLGPYLEAGYGALSAEHLHAHCWELLWWPI